VERETYGHNGPSQPRGKIASFDDPDKEASLMRSAGVSRSKMLLAGYAGGIAGGLTMAQFTRLWNLSSGRRRGALPYSPQEWDATSGIAELAAKRVFRRKLSQREKKVGAGLLHYSNAAILGALYATLVPAEVRSKRWSGPLFGLAVGLIGSELLMPALGLTEKPSRYTVPMRINGLGEHVVYGLTLQLFCGS